MRVPHRTVALLAAAALAGALTLTGCSSDSGSSPSSAPMVGPAGADQAAAPDAAGARAETNLEKPAGPNQAPGELAEDRSLIYTGTITVKVDTVSAMADRAIAAAIGVGGIRG